MRHLRHLRHRCHPRHATILALLAGLVCATFWMPQARADDGLTCQLTFTIKGWSLFYHRASGEGTVRCSDGRSMHVRLKAEGGGLTVGKSVETGIGQFSAVNRIEDVLGSYVAAQAHAGAVNSAQVQVMTKGPVSLALKGKGHGWELGIAFGELKIER